MLGPQNGRMATSLSLLCHWKPVLGVLQINVSSPVVGGAFPPGATPGCGHVHKVGGERERIGFRVSIGALQLLSVCWHPPAMGVSECALAFEG